MGRDRGADQQDASRGEQQCKDYLDTHVLFSLVFGGQGTLGAQNKPYAKTWAWWGATAQ
jgi:hypothetical protein